jgi:hypothetical protein
LSRTTVTEGTRLGRELKKLRPETYPAEFFFLKNKYCPAEQSWIMLARLYQAPGSLLDYCDSSGCLPGQVPLKGVSHGRCGSPAPRLYLFCVEMRTFLPRSQI